MAPNHSGKKKRAHQPFRHSPPGAPPGTLAPDPKAPKPIIRVLGYGPDSLKEDQSLYPREIKKWMERYPLTWISVHGLGDAKVIEEIGSLLHLHPLSLEDVLNVHQRPKLDAFDENLFIVLRAVRFEGRLETEQFSLFVGERFVITFHEGEWDATAAVRDRIRRGKCRERTSGPDYLAYALIDAVIDGYYPPLEAVGEKIEDLEELILKGALDSPTSEIHHTKRDLITLRRSVWPLRDLINSLLRDPVPHITTETKTYLKDCYDHVVQIMDLVETDRELGTDLMDIHLTVLSNRMNEVMKMLAVITTLFMPMTFVTGLYGMNFDTGRSPWNMPELEWYFGYPFALSLMGVLAVTFLWYFKRKGWIGRR